MIDFTSTPIMLTLILGAVGVLIPVISVARKEKGSSVYGVITFGALLFSIFLVYLQKYVIKEYCFYCLISALVSLLIFLNVLMLF